MKQKISNELNEALKYNLSFAGCGFLGIYHGMTQNEGFFKKIFLISKFLLLKLASRFASKSMHRNCCCRRFPERLLELWLQHVF